MSFLMELNGHLNADVLLETKSNLSLTGARHPASVSLLEHTEIPVETSFISTPLQLKSI